MAHIEITDTTGTRWIGDSSPEALTADEQEHMDGLFENWSELDSLYLDIDGAKHYFNPTHVVSVGVFNNKGV